MSHLLQSYYASQEVLSQFAPNEIQARLMMLYEVKRVIELPTREARKAYLVECAAQRKPAAVTELREQVLYWWRLQKELHGEIQRLRDELGTA